MDESQQGQSSAGSDDGSAEKSENGPVPPNLPDGNEEDEHDNELQEHGSAWASLHEGRQLDRRFFQKPPSWIDHVGQSIVAEGMTVPSRKPFLSLGTNGLDWSKTIKSWAKAGRMTLTPKFRKSYRRPGRLVILWDVSGSMSDYFDLYLPWLHGLAQHRPQTGVFAFATQLEEITSALTQSYAEMSSRLAELQGLFAGGTQIGVTLQRWMEAYGEQWLRPPSKLIVISDGWDRGDPADADEALRRIRKTGTSIVWVNPLAATPGFSPRTQTLQTALPYLDRLESGHSPKTLLNLLKK